MNTFSINCKGKIIVIDKPLVMGIINATPDSFFSNSRKPNAQMAIDTAASMIDAGATMLDIGGQSTRPGSQSITAHEETDRLMPIVEGIHQAFPNIILSIDTYYSIVAKATIDAGAHIINDISGGLMDNQMIETVGAMGNVPFVCMHMNGTPQTMSSQNNYDNMMAEIITYFVHQKQKCIQSGIKDIIIDPGFGFSKNLHQNYELMRNLSMLEMIEAPILVGISRKGMIQKALNVPADKALNGTTVLNTMALLNGANIIRVHDVNEATEAVTLVEYYFNKT